MHKEKIVDLIFSENGLLPRSLDRYEEREGQKEMTSHLIDAYNDEKIALIEAGTGIGKSLAYLIPAIFWALKSFEKTVISTHTIALQEQLLYKEIPFIKKMLDAELKVVLVKGMSNYLCLRKLKAYEDEQLLFSQNEREEIRKISNYSEKRQEGSFSDFTFFISNAVKDQVKARSDECTRSKCPFFKQCYFFKARKETEDAHILIVNHHLLLSDLATKVETQFEEKSILPPYDRVVIDEAHHLEEVALDTLSIRIERNQLLFDLGRIHSEHKEQTVLLSLKQALANEPSFARGDFDSDLILKKKLVYKEIADAFQKLDQFCTAYFSKNAKEENKYRLKEEMVQTNFWKEEVVVFFERAEKELNDLSKQLTSLLVRLQEIEKGETKQKVEVISSEIEGIALRFDEAAKAFALFFSDKPHVHHVRWIERNENASRSNIAMIVANLDVSGYLKQHFFGKMATASLCSATLSTSNHFQFLKERLGLKDETPHLIEKIYHSPFDYANRSLLLVPSDLPEPSSPDYISQLSHFLKEALTVSEGGAFLLFTSYEMLMICYQMVSKLLGKNKFNLLKQGDYPRSTLIEDFKSNPNSVLFGTDSFWEGVDIPGDTLRLVVITKLPFKVPSDPLVEAQCDMLTAQGRNPFMEYLVPEAVVKFKQGFGRLIRHKEDHGCVICTDNRIVKKAYGKLFIQSLPKTPLHYETSRNLLSRMDQFYSQINSKIDF